MTLTSGLTGALVAVTVAGSASQAGVSVATTGAQISNGWNGVALNKASLDAKAHEAVTVPPITGG